MLAGENLVGLSIELNRRKGIVQKQGAFFVCKLIKKNVGEQGGDLRDEKTEKICG